jgi:hypothetical protein
MPIFILFVGIMLIVIGINNKIPEFLALIREDFRPTENVAGFHVWIISIVGVGALGYVKELRPLANAFLVLIVISLILSNKGLATQLLNALEGKNNG